jgi:HEAT repeat protein
MKIFRRPNIEKMKDKGDIKGLIKALDYKKDDALREAAAQILEKIVDLIEGVAEPPKPNLILHQEKVRLNWGWRKERVIANAKKTLVEIQDTQFVALLISILNDEESSTVRVATVKLLGAIGDSRAIEPLINVMETNSGMRYRCAYALRHFGEKRVVQALIDVLKSGDIIERVTAACALGEIADKEAVKPLIDALKDEISTVRAASARALGQIGDSSAVKPLSTALKDIFSDDNVRLNAKWALEEISIISKEEPISLKGSISDTNIKNLAQALLNLKKDFENLPVQYPPKELAQVPRAHKQILWICRTLEDAANALDSGLDQFENPISEDQVINGLSQLIRIVNESEYITVMEIAYPGIGESLQNLINKLQRLVATAKVEN